MVGDTLFTEWKEKEDCGLLWAFSGLKRGTYKYARTVYWGRQEKCEDVNFKKKKKDEDCHKAMDTPR